MNSIEIAIGNAKYVIKSEDSKENLREVAELVKRKVEGIKKRQPSLTLQKATILAAFDFANEMISSRRKSTDYRSKVLQKAETLLKKVEMEIESRPSV